MGAMREEIALLIRDMESSARSQIAGREFYVGNLYGAESVLVTSRIGKVASAVTATTLIHEFDVDMILFTGMAGAVSQDLRIGDVVVASELIHHDLDVRPLYDQFTIPLLGLARIPTDERLTQFAIRACEHFVNSDMTSEVAPDLMAQFDITRPKVSAGLVASGDQFITSSTHRDQLRDLLPQVQCVEMEGAAVAQVCYEHDIPVSIIRVISDQADHSAGFDFSTFLSRVAGHYSRGVLRNLLGTLNTERKPAIP
jgi:adenosylhomocysteine nucleosidase